MLFGHSLQELTIATLLLMAMLSFLGVAWRIIQYRNAEDDWGVRGRWGGFGGGHGGWRMTPSLGLFVMFVFLVSTLVLLNDNLSEERTRLKKLEDRIVKMEGSKNQQAVPSAH